MSAFEVGPAHIDALVNAALVREHGGTLRWYYDDGNLPGTRPGEALPHPTEDYRATIERTRREVTRENAEQWGATLLAENRRSVNHRYDEDEWEAPYVFTEYGGQINPVAILSALRCYEYQSCEHPGWKRSEAKAFCEALTVKMIRMLPGYDSAPWEITDPAQAFIGQPSKVWRKGDPMPAPAVVKSWTPGQPAPGTVVKVSDLAKRARPAGEPQFTECDGVTVIGQIGRPVVLRVSGGRWIRRSTGITLPVSNGYRVTVDLAADDTYTVRRVFKRGQRQWIKGERRGVDCSDLADAVYEASCFRNVPFGS